MSKTNSGLVAYAKAMVGKPYWYGCYGQTATAALYTAKKAQYPSYYTASDFASQYGQRVHDCAGLIKGYLWSESETSTPVYKSTQDKSAAGMYSAATSKGKISTFPVTAGLLLFRGTTAAKISHVGVYGGDGYVYEAKGHAYGVVKTAYKKSDWNFWAQHPDITDDTSSSSDIDTSGTYNVKCGVSGTVYTVETIQKGSKGECVRFAQQLLNAYGSYGLDEDGSFGALTQTAVKTYQRVQSLTVDGTVGPNTWTKLLSIY